MSDVIDRLKAALEGRYALERELGAGGMATVFLARDLKHNRSVALKVLRPELAAVVGAERFLAEIETTANLQHPHILPLFDSGEAGGFVFYVMPFVEGETLRDRLDAEKQLPVDEAVRIATNVAEALDYAHAHGVVHRDIKPSNILLQSGKPVISDFGIALAVGTAGGGRLTETGLSLGTPHYMSPEQATGDRAVGAATDVYALGCVLYEMLVGDPPYVGSTAQAILGKIVTEDADPVTKHRRAVPPNVDGAIRKALERLPADRFKTAADFARALEDAGYRHGVAAGVGAGHDAAPWKRAALVLAALLVASTAGLARALLRPEPELQIARFDSPFPEAAVPLGPMEFTPDGSALVYVGPLAEAQGRTDPGVPNPRQLWIRRLDDPEPTPIAGTELAHASSYLALSPDGREVAFADEVQHALFAVPLEGGPRRQLAPSAVGASEWTADGIVYFQSQIDFQIYRVPASGGGEPEPVTERSENEGAHDALHLLPGGRMAVLTAYGPQNVPEIWALDLGTGERRRLTQGTLPRYASSGHLLYVRPDGTLMAAPIDADAELGDAVALIGDIRIGNGQADYALSSRGALAYATGGAASMSTNLVWVSRDGAEQPLGLEASQYAYPRISPDGSRVAVAIVGQATDLWVFDFERLSRSRITYGGNNRYFPVWSPAGDRIAFSNGATEGNALLSAAADGSGRADTLVVRDGLQFPTSWSSDGRFLAFYERSAARAENGRDLWVWPLDGEPEAFLATPFQERAGVFSPDGAWMAYASQKSGRDEIYLRPYPGPGAEVVVSTDGGTEPVWARDGTELFYRTQDRMMAVDMSDPERPGAPKALWPDEYLRDTSGNAAPNYDVHPDGRFLVVQVEQTAEPTTTHVVLNWIEELKARVPR